MQRRYFTAFFIAGSLVASSAHGAEKGNASPAANAQALVNKPSEEPTPKLVLSPPRADFLEKGFVYLPFRVENLTILPLYAEIHGQEVTKLRPWVGHLHVSVDDNGINWIHAVSDAIYFGTLSPGTHRLTLELADAAHNVIDTQTIKLVVP